MSYITIGGQRYDKGIYNASSAAFKSDGCIHRKIIKETLAPLFKNNKLTRVQRATIEHIQSTMPLSLKAGEWLTPKLQTWDEANPKEPPAAEPPVKKRKAKPQTKKNFWDSIPQEGASSTAEPVASATSAEANGASETATSGDSGAGSVGEEGLDAFMLAVARAGLTESKSGQLTLDNAKKMIKNRLPDAQHVNTLSFVLKQFNLTPKAQEWCTAKIKQFHQATIPTVSLTTPPLVPPAAKKKRSPKTSLKPSNGLSDLATPAKKTKSRPAPSQGSATPAPASPAPFVPLTPGPSANSTTPSTLKSSRKSSDSKGSKSSSSKQNGASSARSSSGGSSSSSSSGSSSSTGSSGSSGSSSSSGSGSGSGSGSSSGSGSNSSDSNSSGSNSSGSSGGSGSKGSGNSSSSSSSRSSGRSGSSGTSKTEKDRSGSGSHKRSREGENEDLRKQVGDSLNEMMVREQDYYSQRQKDWAQLRTLMLSALKA